MKISKVVRRRGGGAVSALNAVITANVGEPGQDASASSRQHVKIVQSGGHTELSEHHAHDADGDDDDDGEETGGIIQST